MHGPTSCTPNPKIANIKNIVIQGRTVCEETPEGGVVPKNESICLSILRPPGTPDKSGPMALNQFRPSAPVWSETLWQTFVKHVAISAWLILWIFTSYSYNKFRQLKKSINYILSSSKSNGLYKKSPRFPIPDINFKIAVTWFAKVNNQ